MENLYYNLSEEEFTKGRKILLWIFVVAFFLGGVYVAMLSPVFGVHHIKPTLSLAPFGISFIVGIIALFATIKRKDLFFSIDNDKIEFRYGLFRPKKHSISWTDIKEVQSCYLRAGPLLPSTLPGFKERSQVLSVNICTMPQEKKTCL
jgi:uncharacterized membrane protein YdbT with pleckstrin-like domain